MTRSCAAADPLEELEGEFQRAQSALLRRPLSGSAYSAEQQELLDAIAQDLRISRSRSERHVPSRPEETEAPLALLRHLSRSALHLKAAVS
jgi:hypothetical protein